jgi:hypothetical protein
MKVTVTVATLRVGDYLLGSNRKVVSLGPIVGGRRSVECLRDKGRTSYGSWRAATVIDVERAEA